MSDILGTGSFAGDITDGASTVLTLDPITFDGTTRASFEMCSSCAMDSNNFGPASSIEFHLYEDGSDLGIYATHGFQSAQTQTVPCWRKTLLTPTSGDRTYSIRAISTNNSGNPALSGILYVQVIETPESEDIAYVERDTDFTGSNPWLDSGSITFDGSTRVRIDASCSVAQFYDQSSTGQTLPILLEEDGSSLGQIGELFARDGVLSDLPIVEVPIWLSRYMTPAAGDHTYTIEPQIPGPNATFFAAAGDSYLPAFVRISLA